MGIGVSVGNRSSVGAYNVILGQGGVYVGQDCLLGPHVTIVSENHIFGDTGQPIRLQGEKRARVEIHDDVWIGAGATILAGVTIHNGAVVAAGAVVSSDVAPFSIVGGIPAKPIGNREAGSHTSS